MLKINQALIEAQGISLKRNGRQILLNVNISVHAREIVTVIGPNGAGKSTLIKVILGLLPISAGQVIRSPSLRIGYVPQRFQVSPTVPLSVRRLLTLTHRVAEIELTKTLKETGILHLLEARVADLSGGELQRALLARALLRQPHLLVLDEPVQAVDFDGEIKLYELISNIRKSRGVGILMVSHDLHMVMAESDRVICLNTHICCEGSPVAVQKSPEFAKLFGPKAAGMIAGYMHHHDHDHESHASSHFDGFTPHHGRKHAP
ncbi:MAG: metal ABC transporter ATP-binding protein [Alphaproteobacteria bacterium]|nr:metal ABC transporter ATP-binding protein [Alphaproteobacteria bacterium]